MLCKKLQQNMAGRQAVRLQNDFPPPPAESKRLELNSPGSSRCWAPATAGIAVTATADTPSGHLRLSPWLSSLRNMLNEGNETPKFWEARSGLFGQLRQLAKSYFSGFFEIDKICIFLHRSNSQMPKFQEKYVQNFVRLNNEFSNCSPYMEWVSLDVS